MFSRYWRNRWHQNTRANLTAGSKKFPRPGITRGIARNPPQKIEFIDGAVWVRNWPPLAKLVTNAFSGIVSGIDPPNLCPRRIEQITRIRSFNFASVLHWSTHADIKSVHGHRPNTFLRHLFGGNPQTKTIGCGNDTKLIWFWVYAFAFIPFDHQGYNLRAARSSGLYGKRIQRSTLP